MLDDQDPQAQARLAAILRSITPQAAMRLANANPGPMMQPIHPPGPNVPQQMLGQPPQAPPDMGMSGLSALNSLSAPQPNAPSPALAQPGSADTSEPQMLPSEPDLYKPPYPHALVDMRNPDKPRVNGRFISKNDPRVKIMRNAAVDTIMNGGR